MGRRRFKTPSKLAKKYNKKKLIWLYIHKKPFLATGAARQIRKKQLRRALRKLNKKEIALLIWLDGLL